MRFSTWMLIKRGCVSKMQLKDGPLAQHIGLAFEIWAGDLEKNPDDTWIPEHVQKVRDELEALGIDW